MKLEYPLEIYFSDDTRENYLKGQSFQDWALRWNTCSKLNARCVRKGDIILIFNDSYEELEDKSESLATMEELKQIAGKLSAQDLVILA